MWDRAIVGLRLWQAHIGAGAEIFPANLGVTHGETVLVQLRTRPLFVVAPCRIVYVIDEPTRFGFAYGTLPGHPEEGEESFVVTRDVTGDVRFDVTALSRPAETLAKLGSPAGRLIQRRVTNGYLKALQTYATVT